MNNPSPLIPQGSMLEQKNKSRARVKVAFFCVVGVHVAVIVVALLAQGCKREPVPSTTDTNAPPVMDTNQAPLMDTNPAPAAVTPAPNLPPVPVPETVPTTQEYVIQKGDSFSTIAPKFHITVKALQAANPNVNANRLQIGHKLVIPAPTSTPAPAPEPGGLAPAGEQEYIVKPGDNLTKIAVQFGTTPNAIRKANSLTTDRIKVGDKLKIPGKAAAPASTAPPPAP